jgi:hypothetical protein
MSETDPIDPRPGAHVALTDVLLVFNILSLLFSTVMIWWAVQDMNYEGERWGSAFALFLGQPAILVQFVLLLLTFCVAVVDRRNEGGWFRLTALGIIIAAILLDGAALVCACYGLH